MTAMTDIDIVKQLLSEADDWEEVEDAKRAELFREAADEIERLRAQVAALQSSPDKKTTDAVGHEQ